MPTFPPPLGDGSGLRFRPGGGSRCLEAALATVLPLALIVSQGCLPCARFVHRFRLASDAEAFVGGPPVAAAESSRASAPATAARPHAKAPLAKAAAPKSLAPGAAGGRAHLRLHRSPRPGRGRRPLRRRSVEIRLWARDEAVAKGLCEVVFGSSAFAGVMSMVRVFAFLPLGLVRRFFLSFLPAECA